MAVVVGLSLKQDDTSAKIATALKIPCFKYRAGGLGGGRCTVTCLPNFPGWVVYHIFLPMVLIKNFVTNKTIKRCVAKPKENETSRFPLIYSITLNDTVY